MATAEQQDKGLIAKDPRAMQFKQILEGDGFRRALAATLPRTLTPERMIRVVLSAFQTNPTLLKCKAESVLLSVMRAAAMGLEPDGGVLGHGYLVPFWNTKASRYDCQFIPGYRGLVKLARNSGEVADVWAEVVYEADTFEYELGLDQTLKHKRNDAVSDPGKLKYAYAVCRFRDGEKKFVVMNRREVESVKKRTASKDKAGNIVGPWVNDEPEMWKKTAIRRLSKQLPLSPEAVSAFRDDDDAASTITAAPLNVELLGMDGHDEEPQPGGDEATTPETTESSSPPPTTDQAPPEVLPPRERYDRCTTLAQVSALQEALDRECEDADSKAANAELADAARERIRSARPKQGKGGQMFDKGSPAPE